MRVPCTWICCNGVRASSAAPPISCHCSPGRFFRCVRRTLGFATSA